MSSDPPETIIYLPMVHVIMVIRDLSFNCNSRQSCFALKAVVCVTLCSKVFSLSAKFMFKNRVYSLSFH